MSDIRNRDGGLGFDSLDFLAISGDIAERGLPTQYGKSYDFLSLLIDEFRLSAQRCVLVPGNHDVCWDETVYNWHSKRQREERKLTKGHYCVQGNGYLIRVEKDDEYGRRFNNFSRYLYHPLTQKEYPRSLYSQFSCTLYSDVGIQVLAFNSASEIDEWFPTRAGIQAAAVSRALMQADKQLMEIDVAKEDVLRIAVWHHPIKHIEGIREQGFLDQLRKGNVKLLLHGHVHESSTDAVGYQESNRMRVIGAGSFGAPHVDRPESTPRLYNLVEISRDLRTVRVNTRCLRKEGGAWEGWAVWPGEDQTSRRTFYTFEI